MSKMRIYELAKQLGVANKELMEKMKSIGMEATSHMSMITDSDADQIRKLYQPAEQKAAEQPKEKEERKAAEEAKAKTQPKAQPRQEKREQQKNAPKQQEIKNNKK